MKTVGNIEAGRLAPRLSTVRLLADALRLDDTDRERFYAWASTPVGAPTDPQPPAQLPADVPRFTGRSAQLDQLDRLAATTAENPVSVVISALTGTAGVGKTTLAIHWAHRMRHLFPDGQLYVNLRGFDLTGTARQPGDVVGEFLDALGVPAERIPGGLDARAALYRSVLAGRRVLVVLDNARNAEQVRPLLPGSPGCMALVVSRESLSDLVAIEGARPVSLGLLSVAEAHDMLVSRLGKHRVASEPDAADDIIARCARLPLALAVVSALAATRPDRPLFEFAGDLCDTRVLLDPLGTADPVTDMRAVFSCSYHSLSLPAARLFRLLALHPGTDISVDAAASLVALPRRRLQPLLAELVRKNLVSEPAPGRYTLHDLLRSYAAEQASRHDSDAERRRAVHRILDHYLHTSQAAARLLNAREEPVTETRPGDGVSVQFPTTYPMALEWFTAEEPTLAAAIRQAAEAGFDDHCWRLAWLVRTYQYQRAPWADWIPLYRTALEAAVRLDDRHALGKAHRGLAQAHSSVGRDDEAIVHLEHAGELYRGIADAVAQAEVSVDLSRLHERHGRYALAAQHARAALDRYRTASHRSGEAHCLNLVGWYHAHLGHHRQALTYCYRALVLFRQVDDRDGQGATWDSLGFAYRGLADQVRSIACYRRAVDLFAALGDSYYEAAVLAHLGDSQHTGGDQDGAVTSWRRAMSILVELNHPDAEAIRARISMIRPGRSAVRSHT